MRRASGWDASRSSRAASPLRGVAHGHDHVGARARESSGDLLAGATVGAGDDDQLVALAGDVIHEFLSLKASVTAQSMPDRRRSIAAQRNARPDELDDAEGPRAREEAVRAREHAPQREEQDVAAVASLERVHRHHERDGTDAVDGDGDARHSLSQAETERSRYDSTRPAYVVTRGSFGRPRARSPMMLRWISAVPPHIVSEREKKKAACISETG